MSPETLYLDHEVEPTKTLFGQNVSTGTSIQLKKCSYCGRKLPISPARPGQLSFHKHNAKKTRHQNECRSCKKWRINNAFNPQRTIDQLNESSLITRERRLLLREPEILQTIKERTGKGLKSQVWEKFDKKCFYCGSTLQLSEVQLDHTRPLSYLWPIDEHATCLCAEHNNQKKDKFPADFYTAEQLERLSLITGLSLPALNERDICHEQLHRIRSDIVSFAQRCDPRAYNSIARKIIEVRPEIDLWEELKNADATTYRIVLERYNERPDVEPSEDDKLEDLSTLED